MSIRGKRALIVGGASGLGAATLRSFASAGARCIAADRDQPGLERLASELEGIETLCGDAADPDFSGAISGREVDIMVHTAGIDPLSATDVPGTSLRDWHTVIGVNLTSAFLFARSVLPGMIARRSGCLLFTGSVAGIKPTPREAAYAVSKAGVIQLARAIALDHAKHGIRSNALCPGMLEAIMADRRSAMNEADQRARRLAANAMVPAGREGTYAEVARLALVLCDEELSGYVTGQAIVADGGFLLA
ncbi:SDR family oxidoreductase [Aestuariivirga sp.]|uniref:SDR family NAD(P)-dependent oxidoreductase n=1 Tax=Aestuariivirga sp. TaxID=2650926 RepID=UPI0025C08D0F|nr:SDR family oxidoreductase [Aestuariivirga sp.]MCA3555094.1 SDR family oxidoreductase [Aestuariivirga sp.]